MQKTVAGAGMLLALFLVGCGGRGNLAGKVKYADKPVTYGGVTVVGSDGIPHVSGIDPEGNYLVTDIPTGSVKIAVMSPDPNPQASAPAQGQKGKMAGGQQAVLPSPAARQGWRKLPPQYADLDKSGITTTIQKGDNTYNIDLK